MKLFTENSVIFGIFLLAVPFVLSWFPRIPSSYGMLVSLCFYAVAAYLLNDFGTRAGSDGGLPESIDLLEAYHGGITHTLKHIAWPLAINFCFAVAFGALLIQSKGFVPVPMALWLMMALLVSTVVTLSKDGVVKALASMSPQLWLAFLFAILACVCFQWHAMRGNG